MLIHIVAFKYKPEVDAGAREEHRRQLASLATLDGVIDLQVGADEVHLSRSYDTGLVVRFRDRAALDAYAVDPRHVPIAQHGASLCAHIVSVDFSS
jgi:hypothetical protein